MANYGYIIDLEAFTPVSGDVQWTFDRYNADETTTEFDGIETTRNLSSDTNCVMFASNTDFLAWQDEFTP